MDNGEGGLAAILLMQEAEVFTAGCMAIGQTKMDLPSSGAEAFELKFAI